MDEQDKQEFAQIMYGMADNFRDSISKEGLQFRFEALQRFSIDRIREAAIDIVNSRKFTKFPTIAEFVVRIEGDREQIAEDAARNEAYKVLQLVRERGRLNPPNFSDPVTAELLSRRWRWDSLCSTLREEEEKWFIRDFVEAYAAMSREEKRLQLQTPDEDVKALLSNIADCDGGGK